LDAGAAFGEAVCGVKEGKDSVGDMPKVNTFLDAGAAFGEAVCGVKEELDAATEDAKVGKVRSVSMEEFEW
jgi:hypothetical protein